MFKIGLLILAAAIASCTQTNASDTPQPAPQPAPKVACTEEAKQCPDGSWVGRSGPHCEFICPPPPSN